MGLSARISPADFSGPFAQFRRFAEQRLEAAALIATDRAAAAAKANIRSAMEGAGLGKLGRVIDARSDLKRGVKRRGNGGFSASGLIYARTKSERSLGALASYTKGAEIRPVRGRWLWIATDQIPRTTGRFRMTPELYRKNGFEQKIGPLVLVRSVNGRPLLIVRNVGVSALGAARSAKSLTKRGLARKGQVQKTFLVAFYAIPRTSRTARVNIDEIVQAEIDSLPARFFDALGRI